MKNFEKIIIDLEGLSKFNYIQFLRLEILLVEEYGHTYFGRVRYALNGLEKNESLPMDLGKGIFIATLNDEQLGDIPRREFEDILQEASKEITTILRKNQKLKILLNERNSNHNKNSRKLFGYSSERILKKILKEDYSYLKYDKARSSPPDVLRCVVKSDPDGKRHAKDIFEIVEKLRSETREPYSVGSYGGSTNGGDNLDKVWGTFTIRKFDFEKSISEN